MSHAAPQKSFKQPNKMGLKINKIQEIINSRLKLIINKQDIACSTLKSALEYSVLAGGKRLRPALMLATVSQNFQDNELLLDSACAIELVHTYSIIHDDLPAMDDDDTRRGRPSCHIAYDEATAILAGDGLQSLAFEIITASPETPENINLINTKKIKILNILAKAIGPCGMVAGQSLELSQLAAKQKDLHSRSTSTTTEFLDKIHELKTGRLFTACLQIAAVITNQNSTDYELLTHLGYKLGLAFQIQDDILDYTQCSSILGKPANSDSERNLDTYPSLIGLEQSKQRLNQLWTEIDKILHKLKFDTEYLNNLIGYIKERDY